MFGSEPRCSYPSEDGLQQRSLEMAAQEQIGGKVLDGAIKIAEYQKTNHQTQHRKTVSAKPIEVALRAVLAHEQHDPGSAVERRNRQKIKRAQEQIQREEDEQGQHRQVRPASEGITVQPAHA